ncbi:hypothetical protein BWR15_03955 [Pseudomonas sp. T]|nr:hypothetical protein BWR15_03955 [Pseudomonas sp. T]
MALNYQIEVAVPPETTTTARGRILEKFARKFLETQNYRVQEEVRLTASEVDLLGTEETTSERIFVECKAHRSTISSEVLHKLLGNVYFKNYSSGWLLSTFALGKDARGFEDEWNQKPPEERRKLRIYPPERLVERLVKAQIIVDAASLQIDRDKFKIGNDVFLLLTQEGEFWAVPVLDPDSGIRSAALLFQADTGKQVTQTGVLDRIAKTDTTLVLPWIADGLESQAVATAKLHADLESIVRVPVADHWADYRPARPEDFVGRENVQAAVFQFLDSVRNRSTSTRLIALKGPSGWGKSSSVLKIASRAANVRNKGKYFVFTVDSRAATTSRFPELAVVTAVKAAVASGFINPDRSLEFGSSTSLFSNPAMQGLAEALHSEEKVLCVFFDQFEELLYKADLVDVFAEMRRLCTAVEEAQANLVIGFSWKTDGVIPTEHNAYHMWHSLADRRFEIELSPFTEREVGLAINRFSKELGSPVVPQLRRLLQDHCQGFPWLLKKLCIHILELSRSGIEQLDILSRSMNIQSLFKKDLENLSPPELACIKQVAQESPAEFFKIAQNFGDEIVSRLINKRLVIRSGTKLTIYWDIFRDYILTEKIPYIPVTYVPQSHFNRYFNALAFMLGKPELSYSDLGAYMNMATGATDNLVRDLANVGHVEAYRKESRIVPVFNDEQHAIQIAFSFWRSHDIVRRLTAAVSEEGALSEEDFEKLYRSANKRTELGDGTLHIYSVRVLGWLRGLGIIVKIGRDLVLRDLAKSAFRSLSEVSAPRPPASEFFVGEAPPNKVIDGFQTLCEVSITRAAMELEHGRNTCYALINLGLMWPDGASRVNASTADAEKIVASRARATTTVSASIEILRAKGSMSGLDLGKELSERFGVRWSEGSQRRYGTALRQWAEWADAITSSIDSPS